MFIAIAGELIGVDLMWNWFCQLIKFDSATRRRRTFRSGIEHLECRIVLAANVTAIVRGGSLIVTGTDSIGDFDNNGAEISVHQTGPGAFFVQNGNGTLNGTNDIGKFIGVTRDLRFSFGNGDDSLTFDQTNPIIVKGSITINSGLGHNRVYSTYDNASPGTPAVSGSLKTGGSVSILSAGGQFVSLSNLNVRGDVSIRNLANSTDVFTEVRIGVSEPTRLSQIGGNILIANGPGQNGYRDETVLNSLDVKGSVTIRNQAKNATVEMGSSTEKTTIRGSLKITNGPGEFYQTSLTSVDVKRDVQIDNQGSVAVTNIGAIDGQTSIGGNLRIMNRPRKSGNTETPTADTRIQRTRVGRNLEISATNVGRQNILLLSSTISGFTHLQTGQGDDSFVLNDAILKGKFLLGAGGGMDLISLGTTSTVDLIAFREEVRTGTRTVARPEIDPITGEAHIVYYEEQYAYTVIVPIQEQVSVSAGPVKFHRTARVRFGPGDDVLNLASDAIVMFQKKVVLNGQKGSNTASVVIGKVVGKFKLKHFLYGNEFNRGNR